jgi:hypothetical protein
MKASVRMMWLVAASGFSLMVGCGGGKTPQLPPMVSVNGIVTYAGKPLHGAQLFFHPIDPSGRSSAAVSDASGSFQAITNGLPGIVPGRYKVTVQSYTKKDGSPLQITPEEQANGMDLGQMIAGGLAKPGVPRQYLAVETTPLEYDISTLGSKALELTLQ